LSALILLVLLLLQVCRGADAENQSVAVLYNSREKSSRELAAYYAKARNIPEKHVLGLKLPTGEIISRKDFSSDLEKPLRKKLKDLQLLQTEAGQSGEPSVLRYLVICRGVPVRIAEEPNLKEPKANGLPEPIRRNEAAVDSELACLPQPADSRLLAGPAANPLYLQTNAAALGPQNGLLMVARLDGPTYEIARGLVDQALQAEQTGLWGRAYIDLRGTTNTGYILGDQWLAGAAGALQQAGFTTLVDTNEATFARGYPMSDIAFYAGWYNEQVSGPFTWKLANFRPGAFAYHLHSFNARELRNPTNHWAGPLLAKGAAATVGFVAEPYLSGTLDAGSFAVRWIQGGWSYGEAIYASQPTLSWQTTVVGDPLYRPFARSVPNSPLGVRFQELHNKLTLANDPRLAWSHIQIVNLGDSQQADVSRKELVDYLEGRIKALSSSLLAERLAELHLRYGRVKPAIAAYQQALELEATPGERLRVMLALAPLLDVYQREKESAELYRQLLSEFPDYPDKAAIESKLQALEPQTGK
jgi:uncharacterized protein (TIGR03790 family)